MKATFIERLGAYFLDIIIISILLSIIGYSLPKNTIDYEQELNDITEKYLSNEINTQKYIDESSIILYNSQTSSILSSRISAALIIGYFVIFQYMNQGQTLGKKLFKIKVVEKESKKAPTILSGFIRSLFILNIASGILNIIFIYILNSKTYYIGYGITYIIETLFIIVSIFFVLYREDGRGLHDIMAKTTVIKESR